MQPLSPSSLILSLRALAALTILLHHFALYAPLNEWAAPLIGGVLDWLAEYARATQVFFVLAGYVAAKTLSTRDWRVGELGRFMLQRYCRLGLPYLAIVLLVLPVYGFARGWVPDDVLGQPVSPAQFLAHVFFLQDILGYEALSAGLWFVCINFQLSFAYAIGLVIQRSVLGCGDGLFILMAWSASAFSLFYFNRDSTMDDWGLYFFPYFFMGILVHRALQSRSQLEFVLFQLLVILAMIVEWRLRLVIAIIFAVLLFVAERSGLAQRMPGRRLLDILGTISFSLFLVHFPVLVFTGALWARLGWSSPSAAVAGLLVAFVASLLAALAFYRWVEVPATRLSRRFRRPPAKNAPMVAEPKASRLVFER